jgi:uncharacterized RDD family membrane protein YckC
VPRGTSSRFRVDFSRASRYRALRMRPALVDTEWKVETAEGVTLSLTPAGLIPRLYAYLVDLAFRAIVFVALAIPVALLGKASVGVMMLIAFALEWLYPVFFEVLKGQTPGKAILSLRVVSVDGSPLGFGASLLRNLLRVTDFFPFGYALGALATLASPRFQRLGDLVADALVVHDAGSALASQPIEPGRAAPLRVPLDVDEQRAVIAFAHRRRQLGAARADELASLTGEATEGDGAARVDALVEAARWYEGRR